MAREHAKDSLDRAMIDLHIHLLPGVDDGPADVAASLDLARECVAVGTSTAVATPHIDDWTRALLPDIAAVAERVSQLKGDLHHAGIVLDVRVGGESFLTPDLPRQVEQGRVPTLGGTRWLLVEAAVQQRPLYLEQTLFELQAAGIMPLLAHPERYTWLLREPELMRQLAARGIHAQVTAAALTGKRGRGQRVLAEDFIRTGAAQIVASDTHRAGGSTTLADGRAAVEALVGEERARALVEDNPRAILDGQPLAVVVEESAARRGRRWSDILHGRKPSAV